MENYYCPICKKKLHPIPRYPKYVCEKCFEQATDINGRKLDFYNTSISGGYEAIYPDTKEIYNSNVCYINGIKCRAEEAYFGGIVIVKDE